MFTAQLEKAKEATDAANLRSAYAEISADYLLDTSATHYRSVKLECGEAYSSWENTDAKTNVGKLFKTPPTFSAGATVYVYMNGDEADLANAAPAGHSEL